MKRLAFALVLIIIGLTAPPPTALAQPEMPVVLPMRERAALMDRWLETRLDTVVPALMRREGIEMWIVSAREYNEDPVIETMLPATWIAARRRTILVFFDRGSDEGVERLAVARYNIGPFPRAWDPDEQPDQWGRLAEVIAERDPATIALNRSATFALADGLTDAEYEGFLAALPDRFHDRLVSGERLAIGWLETRIAEEMQVYPMICKIAHAIIAEGLSSQVIQPGVTTTDDVVWWYRERIRALKLTTWFHPSVSVQRADAGERDGDFSARPDASTIYPGDLLHVDFGITYLGLNTDTQQHAYVLRPGETDAPAGLRHALAVGNRLQDILTNAFETGRAGNEILRAALDQARTEDIKATIYTHPIGSTATALAPPSACGTNKAACPDAATIRSSPTPPTPSNSTPPCPSRNGTTRKSASCSKKTPISTANLPGTSTGGRRSFG